MKLLLVTDQFLRISDEGILGPANFCDILKRLAVIGEVHLCLRRCDDSSQVIQVYDQPMDEYIKRENVTYIDKSFIWPSPKTLTAMKRAIAKVDLVVGYVPALNAEIAERLAHKAGKKYFALMVACPWDGLWNQDWKRKIAAPYRFLLNRYVLRHADYALYVTNQFLQRRYPTAVGNSNCVGISDVVLKENHVGVLDDRIHKINNMQPEGIIKLATIAMLNVPYKGQRFVIKALKRLKDKGICSYHYYLIGGGSPERLQRLAVRLGVDSQVHFIGKITHNEVFRLLADIDIYIHPSLQEGLPRSVVEAMSMALPCIGAKTAAIPELLDPTFVVRRKSVNDIVEKLLMMDKDTMAEQARRNYQESQNYRCDILDARRLDFYLKIRSDFEEENVKTPDVISRGHCVKLTSFVATVVGLLPRPLIKGLYSICRNLSGNLGLGLRYGCIRNLANECGTNVAIFPNVIIKHINNLSIGSNVSVHPMCYIDATGGVTIGNDVSIAHGTSVISFEHTWNNGDIPIKYNPLKMQSVAIGTDVWIGCGCRVLSGVKIGNRSIVGAGSIVTKDIAENCVVAGNPAKVIKTIQPSTNAIKPIGGVIR